MAPPTDVTAAAAAKAKARRSRKENWFNGIRSQLMTVAICLIGLAINGIANPPCGRYAADDEGAKPPHYFGASILANEHSSVFVAYAISCSILFLTSSVLIMILATGLPLNRDIFMVVFVLLIFIAMLFIAVVFGFYIYYGVPNGVSILYYISGGAAVVGSIYFIMYFINYVKEGSEDDKVDEVKEGGDDNVPAAEVEA